MLHPNPPSSFAPLRAEPGPAELSDRIIAVCRENGVRTFLGMAKKVRARCGKNPTDAEILTAAAKVLSQSSPPSTPSSSQHPQTWSGLKGKHKDRLRVLLERRVPGLSQGKAPRSFKAVSEAAGAHFSASTQPELAVASALSGFPDIDRDVGTECARFLARECAAWFSIGLSEEALDALSSDLYGRFGSAVAEDKISDALRTALVDVMEGASSEGVRRRYLEKAADRLKKACSAALLPVGEDEFADCAAFVADGLRKEAWLPIQGSTSKDEGWSIGAEISNVLNQRMPRAQAMKRLKAESAATALELKSKADWPAASLPKDKVEEILLACAEGGAGGQAAVAKAQASAQSAWILKRLARNETPTKTSLAASSASDPSAFKSFLSSLGSAAGTKARPSAILLLVLRHLGVGEGMKPAGAKLSAALKRLQDEESEEDRRLQEAREAAQKQARWKASLLDAPSSQARLGATKTEWSRWIEDGRIPIVERRWFRKWRRDLSTTLHDPQVLDALKAKIPAWREDHESEKSKARKSAAAKSAEARKIPKRLSALFASAGLDHDPKRGVGFVSFQERLSWLGKRTVLDLYAPVEAPKAVVSAVSADAPPKGKERTELVRLIEAATAPALVLHKAAFSDALAAWSSKVDAFKSERGGTQAGSAEIDDCLSHALARSLSRAATDASAPGGQGSSEIVLEIPLGRFKGALAEGLEQAKAQLVRLDRHGELRRKSGLDDYASLFPAARAMKRKMIAFLGPTNSGKTHEAMELLAAAPSGTYLAPLRLMAMEGADRLNGRGLPCDMVTGEEAILVEGARHCASTIEMLDASKEIDVAVIDEVQLLMDPDRGWAWTQAVVGAPAKILALTGSCDALPLVERLAAMCGDELEVRTFERMTPLAAGGTVTLSGIQDGDAVVAFSRSEVMRLRTWLSDAGRKVASIYGALGPEVRRSESERFRSGEASVLVATDAIGMGLNLPIRRVVFSALSKFDGYDTRPLTGSEIRQIGGRAGRFGLHESGEALVLSGLDPAPVAEALSVLPPRPMHPRPYVFAPWRAVDAASKIHSGSDLSKLLRFVHADLISADPNLVPARLDDACATADLVRSSGLSLKTKYAYLGCPIDLRNAAATAALASWSKKHAGSASDPSRTNRAPRLSMGAAPTTERGLMECEDAVKLLGAYLWLSLRWPEAYPEGAGAEAERRRLNGFIEAALRRKALDRTCRQCGAKLPKHHGHAICDGCHQSRRYEEW